MEEERVVEQDQDNTQQDDSSVTEISPEEWNEAIETAILNHRLINENRTAPIQASLTPEMIFTSENSRYILKTKMKCYFQIFPWFLINRKRSFRYRESLTVRRGETIEDVTNAINYFWNEYLTHEDYEFLRNYYHQTGPPKKLLWPILKVKNEFEKDRMTRNSTGLQQELLSHATRIQILEHEVQRLLEYCSSSNTGTEPNLKRKFDFSSSSSFVPLEYSSSSTPPAFATDPSELLTQNRQKIRRLEEIVQQINFEFANQAGTEIDVPQLFGTDRDSKQDQDQEPPSSSTR